MICWADQGTTTKMKVHNGMEHRVHSQCYLPVGHQLSGLEVICGRVAYFRMKNFFNLKTLTWFDYCFCLLVLMIYF